jgi:hypothetical protein
LDIYWKELTGLGVAGSAQLSEPCILGHYNTQVDTHFHASPLNQNPIFIRK